MNGLCFLPPSVALVTKPRFPSRSSLKTRRLGRTPTMVTGVTRLRSFSRCACLSFGLALSITTTHPSYALPALPPTSSMTAAVDMHGATAVMVQKQGVLVSSATQTSTKVSSLGNRIATNLRKAGLPDPLVVATVSALPVVELRAGVPLGFLLGVSPLQTFILAVLGNLAPIAPTLLLLRLGVVQRVSGRLLDRARRKAETLGNSESRATALALFVGVPLPGTGAWTGALIAFVLGMPIGTAMGALTAGVVMAGMIMTALCALGKYGAIAAFAVLGIMGLVALVRAARRPTQRSIGHDE